MTRAGDKLLMGVGINDTTDTVVKMRYENGKSIRDWTCPYYERWYDILRRVTGKTSKYRRYDSYKDVKICDEWKFFSNFKRWMKGQDWKGKRLDKDILCFMKPKIYSPDTCLFVSDEVNGYFVIRGNDRGALPVGVTYKKKCNKYCARCMVGGGKRLHLGYYATPEQAHKAWQEAKLAYGRELLSEQTDERVIEGLTKILDNLADDIHNGRITEKLV